MDIITALGGIGAAFGLATSAGLNAYIPLLTVALLARFTPLLNLNAPYDTLTNSWVIGVLIVLRPGVGVFDLNMLVVLFAATMWGLTVVVVKQLTRTDSTVSIVGWMSIIMTVISAIPAYMVWVQPNLVQFAILVMLGVLATIGHFFMTNALKIAEATAVVPVDFARLIWATIIGYFFFSDPLDIWTWVGGIVIFASGSYIVYREAKLKGK